MAHLEALSKEQDSFNAALEGLLSSHKGEWAVFSGGSPAGFFVDYTAAYGFALDTFGLDAVFVVAQVREPRPEPVSISWSTGAMFPA